MHEHAIGNAALRAQLIVAQALPFLGQRQAIVEGLVVEWNSLDTPGLIRIGIENEFDRLTESIGTFVFDSEEMLAPGKGAVEPQDGTRWIDLQGMREDVRLK